MQLLMCRSCCHFQPAVRRNGTLEPLGDGCEKCASEEFLDTRTDEVTRADA